MKTNILIADDEPNQLELMSYNLETSGFGTIKARDGKNALQLIEDHSPDLVILDWMMPNMSGIDLCKRFLDVSIRPQAYDTKQGTLSWP